MTSAAPDGAGRWWRRALAIAVVLCLAGAAQAGVASFVTTEDAIEAPLEGRIGEPTRGAAVVRNRETANCLICHSIPDPREAFMGDIGPPLAGVGTRLSAGQIRLRLVDPTLLNPAAVMPAYHRIAGLVRVDERHRGRPVLTAQEIEDVVAYLVTLGD